MVRFNPEVYPRGLTQLQTSSESFLDPDSSERTSSPTPPYTDGPRISTTSNGNARNGGIDPCTTAPFADLTNFIGHLRTTLFAHAAERNLIITIARLAT